MKVTIISSTQNPVDILLFTKNTRLEMSPEGLYALKYLSPEQKQDQLDYMLNTIKSSWEFVDFTIAIEGVTRAFTHQLVRNRHGSYAQQTMRILDVGDFEYYTGPSIKGNDRATKKYREVMEYLADSYKELLALDVAIEDARGILPTNIKTNIVAKFNLRTLSEMYSARSSLRVQAEYREFLDKLFYAIVGNDPWTHKFLKGTKYEAADLIQEYIKANEYNESEKIKLIKALDILRK